MNTTLWIMQGLLSAFFIMPGFGKITGSKEKHISDGHLKSSDSIIPIRMLGILELSGCIGIIFPWLTGIVPILTPVTAVCFCIIMAAGMIVHAKKREYKMFPLLTLIFILSAVVAYFRFTD
ncbi:DoxX family protein [Chryseobacterium sp. CBSDS_008]|uniref:DoxX family protein n=1 Tax=Chryseobacterium sp. CBSDS_008 TaxID=3415265 RepID=UPI003CEE17AC